MRRLQQEMQQEREKYNQLLLKYQDLQSQVIEDSHVSFQLFCLKHPHWWLYDVVIYFLLLLLQTKQKLQMEIDCKATEIEQLQSKLNETASLSSADNDPEDNQVSNQISKRSFSFFKYFPTNKTTTTFVRITTTHFNLFALFSFFLLLFLYIFGYSQTAIIIIINASFDSHQLSISYASVHIIKSNLFVVYLFWSPNKIYFSI